MQKEITDLIYKLVLNSSEAKKMYKDYEAVLSISGESLNDVQRDDIRDAVNALTGEYINAAFRLGFQHAVDLMK